MKTSGTNNKEDEEVRLWKIKLRPAQLNLQGEVDIVVPLFEEKVLENHTAPQTRDALY
jgi:hypothetical protein